MTIGDTYTISPTMVNSFHATFDRRRNNRASASNLFSPADLGVNMFINVPNYTQLSVSSYSGGGFNVGCGTCAFANFNINTYQLADDFTIIHGNHQIAFGFDGRKDQFNSFNHQQSNGQFTFGGATSGDGLADLLIGRFSNLTDGNVISDYLRQTVMAAYVQDAFKPTSHLTINFGVRWEPSVPAYDKFGRGNQFSYPLFLQGWHSSVYPTAPAGLIFTGDQREQVRQGAHGIALGDLLAPAGHRLGSQGRRQTDHARVLRPDARYHRALLSRALDHQCALCIFTYSDQRAVLRSVPDLRAERQDWRPVPGRRRVPRGRSLHQRSGNLKVTYMMQWNLSYQRQVAKDWLVTANYLGNASRHIWGSTDINYAIPTAGASTSNTNNRRLTYLLNPTHGQYYANIQQSDDGANGSYHGLLLKAEKRMAHHFTLLTTYTYSHCISTWDFAGELAGVLYQNPLNRAQGERGNCGYDHRHNFTTSLVASSAGLGSGAARLITKDWQVSPIVSLFTGNPIQITDGKDISLSGQGLDRPNVILPDQVYASPKSVGAVLEPGRISMRRLQRRLHGLQRSVRQSRTQLPLRTRPEKFRHRREPAIPVHRALEAGVPFRLLQHPEPRQLEQSRRPASPAARSAKSSASALRG